MLVLSPPTVQFLNTQTCKLVLGALAGQSIGIKTITARRLGNLSSGLAAVGVSQLYLKVFSDQFVGRRPSLVHSPLLSRPLCFRCLLLLPSPLSLPLHPLALTPPLLLTLLLPLPFPSNLSSPSICRSRVPLSTGNYPIDPRPSVLLPWYLSKQHAILLIHAVYPLRHTQQTNSFHTNHCSYSFLPIAISLLTQLKTSNTIHTY